MAVERTVDVNATCVGTGKCCVVMREERGVSSRRCLDDAESASLGTSNILQKFSNLFEVAYSSMESMSKRTPKTLRIWRNGESRWPGRRQQGSRSTIITQIYE